jgi:hypothetical protein
MWRSHFTVASLTILGIFASTFLIALVLALASESSPALSSATSSTTTGCMCMTPVPNASTPTPAASSAAPLTPNAPFVYTFNTVETLSEAGEETQSTSPYWFLDSGGKLFTGNGVGETIQGPLASDDKWRLAYAASNPVDTDNGYHPQNIFRLVSKNTWDDADVSAQFFIAADNFSASPNRNESNGLLLMSRYQDHNTLYYAGIRVDGTAVIKKKYQGTYYTLAQTPVFAGVYNHDSNPNLLPHNTWIALRSVIITNEDNSVSITLYMNQSPSTSNNWIPLLSARDDGSYGNTPPITNPGSIGIRTDFMDVDFQNLHVSDPS